MILLVLLSFLWFYQGKKLNTLLVFFFFVTDGFQLVPEFLFSIGLPFKSPDYALLILVGIGFINFFLKKYSIFTALSKLDYMLMGLFLGTGLLSFFVYGIPLADILKTQRFYLLFFSVFLFTELEKDEFDRLKNILLFITLFQSVLFCIQTFTGLEILNGYAGGGVADLGGMFLHRFYNLPFFGIYMLFYVLFDHSLIRKNKIIYALILGLPIIFSLHRGLIIAMVFTFILLVYLTGVTLETKMKRVLLIALFAIPVSDFLAGYLQKREGTSDILSVLNGDFKSIDYVEQLADQTFLFRIAHLYERYEYLTTSSLKLLWGGGWMHERSSYTQNNFDFMIGLRHEDTDEIIQIDTSDIAWSVLLIRLGIIGSIIYLIYMAFLIIKMLRHRSSLLAVASLGFLLVAFITTFTNIILVTPLYFTLLIADRVYLKKYYSYDKSPNNYSNSLLQSRPVY